VCVKLCRTGYARHRHQESLFSAEVEVLDVNIICEAVAVGSHWGLMIFEANLRRTLWNVLSMFWPKIRGLTLILQGTFTRICESIWQGQESLLQQH